MRFHILPTMPRIRFRMPCTGFSYSHGINSHSYVKSDYSSILPPKRKWFFNGRPTSPYPLYHSCVSTHKYSRPRSNGRLYLFQYCYIGLSQPEEHASDGYFPIEQHAQKNSQSLCIFFFNSASQKRLFCIVVNRSKKIQSPRGGGIQMAKRPAITTT